MIPVVLTVCGSFHAGSANRAALNCATAALQARSAVCVKDAAPLDRLPALNPELLDSPPVEVSSFRAQIEEAQGMILAAPEYAGGLAGSVKNALDWCVGSGCLYGKPVVLMSAGTSGGTHALSQLVRTLLWQGAHVVGYLGVAAPKTKSDALGRLVDPQTLSAIDALSGWLVDALSMSDSERSIRTRHVAAEIGIHEYPHMPD